MKYNPIFPGIKENTIENLKLVLVEFQRELENDDAFELANVHRFGKGFKTRPTCTLMFSKHDSDFVHKKSLKAAWKICPNKHVRQFQARLNRLEGVNTQS